MSFESPAPPAPKTGRAGGSALKHADNPAREIHGKLTERCPKQKQDHHDIRTLPASKAYADGWDRIWGRRRNAG